MLMSGIEIENFGPLFLRPDGRFTATFRFISPTPAPAECEILAGFGIHGNCLCLGILWEQVQRHRQNRPHYVLFLVEPREEPPQTRACEIQVFGNDFVLVFFFCQKLCVKLVGNTRNKCTKRTLEYLRISTFSNDFSYNLFWYYKTVLIIMSHTSIKHFELFERLPSSYKFL